MQIKLPNGKWITLNEQQREAMALIKAWLSGDLEPEHEGANPLLFCLEGFAGTGKTTIIKEAIDWYGNTIGRWDSKVAVTAPTHQAKKEISNATGLEGKTIQSLIGLAPNVEVTDFDINNPEFAVMNKPAIHNYRIIIIDESSMLNTDLFKLLSEQATTFNTKLLFMCDSAQLPPVNEDISPVVISKSIAYRFRLTKVERQAGDNPLMLVYDKIRDDTNITLLTDSFEHKTELIELPKSSVPVPLDGEEEDFYNERLDAWNALKPTIIGVEFIKELPKFGGKVVTAFASQKFQEDAKHCKVFAWTNEQVKFWNDQIRRTLIMKNREGIDPLMLGDRIHDEFIMPGELLLGYQSYSGGIQNACQYRVTKIVYDEEHISYDKGEQETSFKVYKVTLQDIDKDYEAGIECKIIEPELQNYKNFVPAFQYYLSLGKFQKLWSKYYGWKANYMLIQDIKDVQGKLIVKKDLDYGYALSIHKAQGSTYDQVFIDEENIDKLEGKALIQFFMKQEREKARKLNYKAPGSLAKFDAKYPTFNDFYQHQQIVKNKLKYVALSRPRHKATVFSSKTVEHGST